MNLKLKSKEEQLEIAKSTSCPIELKSLHLSQYMNVRRAVARNTNICTQVANTLAYDPVLNVSYMALKNPKSTVKRSFDKKNITFCVICENDERTLNCLECENKKKTLLNI